MATFFNSTTLVGRLTRDAELKLISSTNKLSFTLAVDRPFSDKRQPGASGTDFIPIAIWGKRAESLADYLRKGKLVMIYGRLQIHVYPKDGINKKYTEVIADRVIFFDTKPLAGEAYPSMSLNSAN